ncbi:MAG: peptidoglycan-associated lipoprotein Pal [Rickettsiales bacterium]|nr:peptidoglycan-associated lipoprotein Pal [Rickettsiales bacterium]
MFKKILMLCFVLTLVSACASKNKVNTEEDYDVIDSEQQADKMNKNASGNIEEVSVPDRVYFDFDKYNISNESADILKLQAEWLKSDTNINVVIEGHCDERGTREYNLALGERRATAVKKYLVKQGVAISRIKTISYGKERPIFVGSGEAVWAKNRVGVTVVAE